MAFIPVVNVAQFDIRYTMDGERVENTIYCKRDAGWTTTELNDAAAIIKVELVDNMVAHYSDVMIWQSIMATDLTTVASSQTEYTGTGPVPGSGTGAVIPNNVAWCIKFLTALRGRNYRGRNYIGGFVASEIVVNEINEADADDIVALYTDTFAALEAASYVPVVVSRFALGAPRLTGVATPIVNVAYTDLTLDSQRRRLPRRGE